MLLGANAFTACSATSIIQFLIDTLGAGIHGRPVSCRAWMSAGKFFHVRTLHHCHQESHSIAAASETAGELMEQLCSVIWFTCRHQDPLSRSESYRSLCLEK